MSIQVGELFLPKYLYLKIILIVSCVIEIADIVETIVDISWWKGDANDYYFWSKSL